MSEQRVVEAALEAAGIPPRVRAIRPLCGGCIHRVLGVSLDGGREFVAKINEADRLDLFVEESAGLAALAATGAVLVPSSLTTGVFAGHAVLLMTAVDAGSPTEAAWTTFGHELAALHAADMGNDYGFNTDNHLGTTPQPNPPSRDWVEFNAEHRLGHQVRLATENGRLEPGERDELDQLIQNLDQFIPRRPRPSLLHGDLWSGNALPARDKTGANRIAMIDPACSIGDALADIAMMQLFGGFPQACYAAYFSVRRNQGADDEQAETRIAVYQLYHVLNHLNLFGRSYAAQAMALAKSLTG